MPKQNLTIFQRLGQVLSPDRKQQAQQPQSQRFNLNKNVLLKTDDKQEYEVAKLQAQQNKYIESSWKKVENGLFQQAVNYETTRIGSYSDFEAMEYFPEIAAALDCFSEETTTLNANGRMINVYSDSKRVKGVIEDLLFNRLDIHTSLPMWTRNTCKLGDNFVFLNIDDKNGIIGAKQMPNYEMERRDGGLFDASVNINDLNKSTTDKTKFYWRGRDIEFNSWQIAHFRLLGDDRRLPYGTSILEKARRIWKQLCLSENSLVWTNDGFTEIKNIKKGDLIYSYDQSTSSIIKSKVKDCWNSGFKKTSNVRTRYSSIDVTDEHQLLTYCDGIYEYKTIKNIVIGKDKLITPSIDFGVESKIIKLDSTDYYIKLNENGLLKSKQLNRSGITNKLKSINTSDYKNIHRFLQGNGKIKYEYIHELTEYFNILLSDVDIYYNDTKSILNKNLEFEVDTKFIEFFGFMLGDGWLTKNGIGFALGIYDEQNNHYINYVKNHIKEKLQLNESKHSIYSKSIIINNREIKNIFIKLGFITGFDKKRIPSWIYEMNLNFKRDLIKGLFNADGSDKYGVIGLANYNLINDLKQLCLQSGIGCGSIGKTNGSIKFNEKTGKNEKRQDSYKLYINFNNITDTIRFENILDITENEGENVWDLEVDNELHNFVSDGFVVHNCLSEDAMLVYRVTRAPERRVYKIYVGNLDDADVGPYVNEIANRFKRSPVIDPQTGQMDLRYNQLPVWKNTPIPLLDGRTITIEELAKEYDEGKENFVYSVNDKTHQIVGGKVKWCGKNYTADKMIRVWLDDNTHITTASEHPFLVYSNETKNEIITKRADELNENDSLVGFYRKKSNKKENKINGYEMVYSPATKKYEFTHRIFNGELFSEEIKLFKENKKQYVIHHKDFLTNDYAKLNNHPDNLTIMDSREHFKLHSSHMSDMWKNEKYRTIFLKNNELNNFKTWNGKNAIENKKIASNTAIKYLQSKDVIERRAKTFKEKYRLDKEFFTKQKDNLRKQSDNPKNRKIFAETIKKTNVKIWSNQEFIKKHKERVSKQMYEYGTLFKNLDLIKSQINKIWSLSSLLSIVKNKNIKRSSVDNFLKKEFNFENINDLCSFNIKSAFKKYGNQKDVHSFFNIEKNKQKYFNITLNSLNLTELKYGINHKVKSIEIVSGDDVYCMTVVGPNGEDDRHNFAALSLNSDNSISESGSFLKNSQEQDFFIPVRTEDAPNPIDTLPGAQNLNQIEDITFLQRKLFTALRVPKAFLGFDEATGDGKNLSLLDIRFSRTVNRIQQAMLQELNKIVIIHLHLLGFEDDLDNFSLTLNNPSTQAEMLRVEHTQAKVTLYKDSVSDAGNGFGAMSMTRAKREILGWSDNEIKQDLLEQRMEKAAAAELQNSANVIKHTGMFDVVDRVYGDMQLALKGGGSPQGEEGEESSGGGSGGGLGGGFGGGGLAADDLDFGGEEGETDEEGSEGGDVGGSEPTDGETPEDTTAEEPTDTTNERIAKTEKLLKEHKEVLTKKFNEKQEKYTGMFVNRLIDMSNTKPKPLETIKIQNKNIKINESINGMIRDIDGMLDR